MSINVTVNGNPISIKRGKMVALDSDKEFNLRRKIRLQQVRQQSKDIAEGVRNRVRKAKSKELSKAEKDIDKNLKDNQARKLYSLKEQYQNCLDEYGAAHKLAEGEPDSNEIITKVVELNREKAEERGRLATVKCKEQKKQDEAELQMNINNKKQVRVVEDLRSKLVSNLKNGKKKKRYHKSFTDITINGVTQIQSSDSELENLSVLGEISTSSKSDISTDFESDSLKQNQKKKISFSDVHKNKHDYSSRSETENISPNNKMQYDSTDISSSKLCSNNSNNDDECNINCANKYSSANNDDYEDEYISQNSEEFVLIDNYSSDDLSDYHLNEMDKRLFSGLDPVSEDVYCNDKNRPVLTSCAKKHNAPNKVKKCEKDFKGSKPSTFRKMIISRKSPMNLEISDDDSHKKLLTSYSPVTMKRLSSKSFKMRRVIPSKTKQKTSSKNPIKSSTKSPVTCSKRDKSEQNLPYVPSLKIRPETSNTQDSTYRYYDHFNRFKSQRSQPVFIQKINQDSIVVGPPSDEDLGYKKMMEIREEEAKIRGNRALERNKIQRNYQQLLEELPLLQRQERLYSMNTHNPALHMSENRLQELERRKQNKIETLFENYQSKSKSLDAPIITLPSVKKSPPSFDKEPFITRDSSINSAELNVGVWINTDENSSDAQISADIFNPTGSTSVENNSLVEEKLLVDLLSRVNKQRDLLMREAANMTSLSQLKTILNEEDLLSLIGGKTESRKVLVETGTSPLITVESANTKSKIYFKDSNTKADPKRIASMSSSDTSSDVPVKLKPSKSNKRQRILIREEGTQTTPAISKREKQPIKKENPKKEEATQTSPYSKIEKVQCLCPISGRKSPNTDINNQNDVCEIVIKPHEDSNVFIQQPNQKPIYKKTTTKNIQRPSNVVIKIKETQDKRDGQEKNTETTTSTSYCSPPVELGTQNGRPSNKELFSQKKQTNIDNLVRVECGAKEINPRLLRYIKKLLGMSRQSIDDLTISSVSDVSTPQDSIVRTSSNIAREKLQLVMDHFNLTPDDLKKYYMSSSYSSSFSNSDLSLEKDIPQMPSPRKKQSQTYSQKVSTSKEFQEPSTSRPRSPQKSPKRSPRQQEHKQYSSISTSTDPDYIYQKRLIIMSPSKKHFIKEEYSSISTTSEQDRPPIRYPPRSQPRKKSPTSLDIEKVVLKPGSPKETSCDQYSHSQSQKKSPTLMDHENFMKSSSPTTSTDHEKVVSQLDSSKQTKDDLSQYCYSSSRNKSPTTTGKVVSKTGSPKEIKSDRDELVNYCYAQSKIKSSISTVDHEKVISKPRSPNKNKTDREELEQYRYAQTSPKEKHIIQKRPENINQTSKQKKLEKYDRHILKADRSEQDNTLEEYRSVQTNLRDLLQQRYHNQKNDIFFNIDSREEILDQYCQVSNTSKHTTKSPQNMEARKTSPKRQTEKHDNKSFNTLDSDNGLENVEQLPYPCSPKLQSSPPKEASRQNVKKSSKNPIKLSITDKDGHKKTPNQKTNRQRSPKKTSPPPSNIVKSPPSRSRTPSPAEDQGCNTEICTSPPYVSPRKPKQSTSEAVKVNPPKVSPAKQDPEDQCDTLCYPKDLDVLKEPNQFLEFVRDSLGMTEEEFEELGFKDIFSRHITLTEYCHKRIRSLVDLIEKVRRDRQQLYSPSPVDNSMTLTSYMDMPHLKQKTLEDSSQLTDEIKKSLDNDTGSFSSVSQEAIDNYLLTIENRLSPEKTKQHTDITASDVSDNTKNINDIQESFIPMLQGIPKYNEENSASCRTTAPYMSQIISQLNIRNMKPRPPPSLMRSNLRGHVDAIPHELSTIVEAETLVSSKNNSVCHPVSPEKHDDTTLKTLEAVSVVTDSCDYVTISPERTICSDEQSKKNCNKSSKNDTSNSSYDKEYPKSCMSGVHTLSDSPDSPDELESMLRKFKLEWAIALVKKTEQALALSSSSSASDIGQPKKTRTDYNSDVSFKEIHSNLLKKLSFSSSSDVEKSQIILSDLSHHFREFHDISEIPGVADSRNKSQQRTSTPVRHSKSSDSKMSSSKENLFRGDSELSSVRNSSDDNLFLSIPNITLNTTNCSLNKSKKKSHS